MKANKMLFGMASLMVALSFTACSSEDADNEQMSVNRNSVINLTSSLAQTRAASDPQTSALNTSNKVGVFVTSNAETITNGNNNEHSVGATGALITTNTMNYPAEDGAEVDIFAYAPYASGMALSSDNAFSVATDQSTDDGYLASDLVYASKTGQTASTSAVSLTFAHKLSKLNITINNTNTDIDMTNAIVYVTGTKIATTFNPSTGAVGEASGSATDIKAVSALGTGTTACAVIVPQDIAAQTELVKIVAGSKTLVAKLATATTFAAGSAYNFTANITKDDVVLTLSSTAVTDWSSSDLGAATMEEKTTEVTSPFYATFGTPGNNATYNAETFTYTWTGSTSNLMTVFEFSNGELASYTNLKFTFTELSGGSVRLNFLFSDNSNISKAFYTAGAKTVTLSELDLTANSTAHTLADVTAIRFGGNSLASGNTEETTIVKASEMYLEK